MAKRWYYKDENGNKVPVPQYKINSDNHYTKSEADNKFATKESTDTKVAKTDIVQSVGNATDKIMSQKAVSDIVDELERKVTNAADGEDITVIEENGKQKLKFADRNYNPQTFSGKGYKIIRKN